MTEIGMHPALSNYPIYLDYNATTPIDPRVVDAMLPYLTMHFGNPSSSHCYAQAPRTAIQTAREHISLLLGCTPDEILFTGSGSESDTLALRGVALAQRSQGHHIITQQTEHPAILQTCHALERLYGFHVTYLPVDQYGRVDPAELQAAITNQTVLITIMHANNETGTLQPITELARIAHSYAIPFHTDASQSVGKIPTRVTELGVDLLTIAGHKLYAPKGVGVLYVRKGLELEPLIYGGGQERGRRAGTENTALIVALGAAALLAATHLDADANRLLFLRDLLHRRLEELLPGRVHLNGHPTERLPNTLNISIDGTVGEQMLAATPDIASATGSACHEGLTEPSSVLLAMGCSRERALSTLRLTLGRWSTAEQVEQAAQHLGQTISRLFT